MSLPTDSLSNTVIRLGSVEVPVAIHAAAENKDVSFQMAGRTGGKVKQFYRDLATGELLEPGQCQKGVFVGDEFKPISKEEIDKIKEAGYIDGLVVDATQAVKDLPIERTKGTYYLTTQIGGEGAASLRVLRDALKRTKLALVGKMTLKSRQYPFAVTGVGDNLVLTTMRFADSYVDADLYAESMEAVSMTADLREAVKTTVQVLNVLEEEAPLDDYTDDAIPERIKLRDKAINGKPVKPRKRDSKSKASSEMLERLAASMEAEKMTA